MSEELVANPIDPTMLRQYGLQEDDLAPVQAISEQLDFSNPASIHSFGANIANKTESGTEEILRHTRSRDMEVLGGKLEKILLLARDSAPTPTKGVSALPVIGSLIQRAKGIFQRVSDRFASASTQIDALIHEVDGLQTSMLANSQMLEQIYAVVQEEYRSLGQYIVAGKMAIQRLSQEAERRRQEADLSQMDIQRLADLDASIAALDRRVGNFVVLQQAALQKLPTIRMIQANHQTLLEKYETIKHVVIPSWRHQALLATSLQEQHNAVALADAIDVQTNRMLTENAALLYKNSTEAAKANQRLCIDPKTLEEVHETLAKTIDDVIRIRKEGMVQRKDVEGRMIGLQSRMRKMTIANSDQGKLLH